MADLDIVHRSADSKSKGTDNSNEDLVSWCMTRISAWEDYRETNFRKLWTEYYRLWRGKWNIKDKNRDSERSRIISPALSQAIEATVAEIEEASFGSGKWFDISDDWADEDKTDISMFRDQLREDLNKSNVPSGISEIFLNGAIYGTGIGKIIVEEYIEKTIVAERIGVSEITEMQVEDTPMVRIKLVAVHPEEFVIDPAARTIDDALGMAHITTVPRHTIEKKIDDGIYDDVEVSGYSNTIVGDKNYSTEKGELRGIRDDDKTMLVEYHGLVPRDLLPVLKEDGEVVDLFPKESKKTKINEFDLVEAIVSIANGTTLLRGIANPFKMKDRCFVAYQHDTVPNQFWGRGIAEKGYNPQKALDAELRGRIDAMALSIHPMMGIDATRIPRGGNFRIAPGKNVFTNGDPSTILKPFNFGQVNPTTFNQTGDLERQVQMGTGAMDSATPMSENRRNETSSGMSMIQGGAIKRSKRTLANIERNFMKPLIHKAAWRYMQFAPDRYPTLDVKFTVHSTLGMIARELEQQQLATMMQTVPQESPAFWMLLKGVYENSSISNREEMLPVIDQMMQKSLEKQAQPPQPDPMIEIKKQEIQLKAKIEEAKLQMEGQENQQEAQFELEQLKLSYAKLELEREALILKAKVEAAKMEQDSMVTAVQMQVSASQSDQDRQDKRTIANHKAQTDAQKAVAEAPAAVAKSEPVVINTGTVTNVAAPEKSGTKKIKIKRTTSGLEGTLTEEKKK